MIITIDGRAGTGKTTVAREVAKALDFQYVDTGAMYRAVTYKLLKESISLQDATALKAFLGSFTFHIKEGRYFVGKEEVTKVIRSLEVTEHVSKVSALKEVRLALVDLQRALAKKSSSVFEGRDMGSVVFPKADLKVFLTATDEVCAKRRFKELNAPNLTEKEVLTALKKRNAQDETRENSPLVQPQDAHVIDTSHLTINQVVQKVVSLAT